MNTLGTLHTLIAAFAGLSVSRTDPALQPKDPGRGRNNRRLKRAKRRARKHARNVRIFGQFASHGLRICRKATEYRKSTGRDYSKLVEHSCYGRRSERTQ